MNNYGYMTGADLKRRREALSMTQKELAEYWGVTAATISNWESGGFEIKHPKIVDDALSLLERNQPIDPGSIRVTRRGVQNGDLATVAARKTP